MGCICVRKQNVLRYQRGNQKPQIEEQTIQWLCGKTTIYKTLRRKLKIEQYETHQKPGLNSTQLKAGPVSRVAFVVLPVL
jgi:hypothetical protein